MSAAYGATVSAVMSVKNSINLFKYSLLLTGFVHLAQAQLCHFMIVPF